MIGDRQIPVVHTLTADEISSQGKTVVIPGSRLDFSGHPTDDAFKIFREQDHPRDASGRFADSGGDPQGPRNPERDHAVRQDFANGSKIPDLVSKYKLSDMRIRNILREAPLPPPTVTLPPGTVIPTFKPKPKPGELPVTIVPRRIVPGFTLPPAPTAKPGVDKRSSDDILAEFLKANESGMQFNETRYHRALIDADTEINKHARLRMELSTRLQSNLSESWNKPGYMGPSQPGASGGMSTEEVSKIQKEIRDIDENLTSALQAKLKIKKDDYKDYIVNKQQSRDILITAINPSKNQGNLVVVGTPISSKREVTDKVIGFYRDLGMNIKRSAVYNEATQSRSSYHAANHSVHISRYDSSGNAIAHELGHHLEHVKDMHGLAVRWRNQRAHGEIPSRIPGHSAGEIGVRDKFITLYTGRIYDGDQYKATHTEVISMGMEYLWDDPLTLAKKDPDHFKFMVDVIRQAQQ